MDATPVIDLSRIQSLITENERLRREIRVAREAADITADLVVRQFEETERLLDRYQMANAQRKAVLDSASNVSIIATNTQGIITVFNTGAENLLGYKAGEVIGLRSPEMFHLDEELTERCQRIKGRRDGISGGPHYLFEYAIYVRYEQSEWTYIRKDGSRLTVSLSINTLRDPAGSVGGFLFIAHDVTEKKRSEKALKESEEKYRLLINNLPNVVFKGYADGAVEFLDDKIEKVTGYSKEDFFSKGISWLDIVYEPDMEAARDIFLKALKGGKSYFREYRIKARNGRLIWIEEGGQIVLNQDGRIDFITGAFLDITERKTAEKALSESEEKYRSLFDSGPNPILVLDRQTLRVIDANPSAEKTYGYDRVELVGKFFSELGVCGDRPCEPEMLPLAGWSTGNVDCQKVRQFKKNEKPFYINFSTCHTRYRGQNAIILAVTDITEMMEKDAQLIQASKMTTLGEMSAGIAHELNQPLNAIKLGNEFIKTMIELDQPIPSADLRQVAEEVSGQVDRASEIINRLRAFGRKTDFEKELIDVNQPVRNVLRMIGRQLRVENISVTLELDDTLPQIIAHGNRLEQVLFNLITNARDAINQRFQSVESADERAVHIRTFAADGRVAVSIRDTGIGMTNEIREKIFEPFFTTKEVGQGMGLGLAIIYGIIRDYGGEIQVESKEGHGTLFICTFPVLES